MSNYFMLDHHDGIFKSYDYLEDVQQELFVEYKIHTLNSIKERFSIFRGSNALEIKAITHTRLHIEGGDNEDAKADTPYQTAFL
jgi:hypothetical protein